MPANFSANYIYQQLRGSNEFSLTPWQVAAIESDPSVAALIIAGAGSGKTELMAVRVLWLVANGHCQPSEVLGLTFTRKAAASLTKRIGNSIAKLRKTEIWPEALRESSNPPVISTYNSYANSLFRDSALALGYEPESLLLSEAQRYQLARQVVLKHAGDAIPNLEELDKKPKDLIESVLKIAGEMNDHDRGYDEILEVAASHFGKLEELEPTKLSTAQKTIDELKLDFALMPGLAKLAQMFRDEKHRLGYVDFSDQVLLAKRALELTDLAKQQQGIYKHVLLDEYQDTSYLQTALLEGLYRGTPVYAVGDPNQSIYGWRGASSSNLAEFLNQFATPEKPVAKYELPTSWRNPSLVLDLANKIAEPLKVKPTYSNQELVEVDKLLPRPGAPVGTVELDFLPTLPEEVNRVADWFAADLNAAKAAGQTQPTAALLLRKRAAMSDFVAALQNRGISVEVLGLGGLLQMPEVIDVVSALKVINSPSAGTALIRLLSGARWQIGARDIAALDAFADALSRSKAGERDQDGYGSDYEASIVDALDLLASDYREWRHAISDTGLERMKDAANLFRNLRSKQGLPLQELVRVIEQELWLDIELRANPSRVNPMQHLNAFVSIVGNYDSNSNSGLASFLEWLDYAATLERFDVAPANAQAGVVQVMTIHASKGLEWDMVAIGDCSMSVSGFSKLSDDYEPESGPSGLPRSRVGAQGTRGWLKAGSLPYSLRGDANSLPVFALGNCRTHDEVHKVAVPAFKDDVFEMREREERRLMYVALTRPQQKLLVTGSSFAAAKKGKKLPDYYLEELIHSGDSRVKIPANYAEVFWLTENPLDAAPNLASWPLDPIGAKYRDSFERSKTEAADWQDSPSSLGERLQREIELLLDERASRVRVAAEVELPVRIQASRFKDFVTKTGEMAERFRRPVPEKPYTSTMQGTLFHNWVEARYGFIANAEELDATDSELDESELSTFEQLEQLKQTFEKSRWAELTPVDVECEIQVTIGSNTFICKLDAVFETDNGFEIVDWKTGKPPKANDEKDLFERSLQLSLYRMAYARYRGIPEDDIEVSLYFVNEDREIRPEVVLSERELIELWTKTVQAATATE
ncbi:MAG: ATP-dependent helicase [Actinomycetales bacterium]|nr:ATP-dependent helicase [Actinomycetales bacterium]